jgi:hypothetical protein
VLIEKGQILEFRIFDIAEEIDLHKVELLLNQKQGESRVNITSKRTQTLIIKNPPIRLQLGEVDIPFAKELSRVEITATLWEYGSLSLCFSLPLKNTPAATLLNYSVDLSYHEKIISDLNHLAQTKVKELLDLLKPAFKRPTVSAMREEYTVYFVEKTSANCKPRELLNLIDIPSLILAEKESQLSDSMREGILNSIYQYTDNDMVILDWNSAFVFEPSGTKDVVEILEFTLSQLLELRYYDDLLDHHIEQLYDNIEERRQRIFRTRISSLLHSANRHFLEFSEFVERITNSLKVVGDFYLATIYRSSIKKFRVNDWQDNVNRKISLLGQVSELLESEVNTRRGQIMELIIILLIFYEIVSPMFKP